METVISGRYTGMIPVCSACGHELALEILSVDPLSVIVVKNCRGTDKVEAVRSWLRLNGCLGALVIDMQGEQALAILPEDQMEAAGWVRVAKKRRVSGETG